MVIFINTNCNMNVSSLSFDEQLKEAINRSNMDAKEAMLIKEAIKRSLDDKKPTFIPSDEKRNFLLESYEKVCKEKDYLSNFNRALNNELKKLHKKVKLLQEENNQLRKEMTKVVPVEDVQVVS